MIIDPSTNTNTLQQGQVFDYTPENTLFPNHFESTIDISNITVKEMPIEADNKTLTGLSTINLAEFETATASMLKANGNSTYTDLTTVSMNAGYRNDLAFDDNSTQFYDDDDDDEDEDEDDDDEEYEVKPSQKRTRGVSTRAKRFSTASTNSSSQMTDTPVPIKKSTKGRKPKSETNVGAKLSAQDVARFGNKYVKKGTEEYEVRRNRNNEAVKKCREKSQVKQQEREEKLQKLTEENRKLSNTVDSLTKELNVLKNILLQMNPQNRLPNDIEEKITRLEAMIINNNQNNAKS